MILKPSLKAHFLLQKGRAPRKWKVPSGFGHNISVGITQLLAIAFHTESDLAFPQTLSQIFKRFITDNCIAR